MANDGKIYITISDRRFGSNVAEADEQNKLDKEKNEKKSPLGDYATHRFFNMIESQAKQAVNFTLGNIGNFTGDYVMQQEVNNALSILNTAEKFVVSAAVGLRYGVAGAAIGLLITGIGEAASQNINYFMGYMENIRQNRQIDQLRSRAGLSNKNNYSRGTEY